MSKVNVPINQSPRRRAQRSHSKRRSSAASRNQRLFAILAIVIVFSLVATIVGPPLVDYLTRQSDEKITLGDASDDPVEREYRARIESNPRDADALAGLANYLGNTGRVDEAIPLYERSLDLEPANWATRLAFARVLSNADKRLDAELQFGKVLAACPGSEQTLFSLGQLYANWAPPRTAEAIAAYQQVVITGPGTFVAERAAEELARLGSSSPVAASPVAIAGVGSPDTKSEECP